MYMKRLYDHRERDPNVALATAPTLKIINANELWRVSTAALLEGVMAGYITMAKGRVILHGIIPGGTIRTTQDVVFRIKRVPGIWCCHCGLRLPSSPAAQKHVIDKHAGLTSPDTNNPSGYQQLNAVECIRE